MLSNAFWTKIPNALTLSRYGLGFFACLVMIYGGAWSGLVALVLVGVGELTDLGNGKLARRLGIADPKGIGGILDTTADHYFRGLVLFGLVYIGQVSPLYLVAVFTVDFGISYAGRLVLTAMSQVFPPVLWVQKAKAAAQGLFNVVCLAHLATFRGWQLPAWWQADPQLWASVGVGGLTVVAGLAFLKVYLPDIRELVTA